MNCRPGDLAVIVREADRRACAERVLGLFCRVLYAAPQREFRVPDGRRCMAAPVAFWVVEFDREILVVSTMGFPLRSRFAAIGDFKLRPIRDPGEQAKDETITWAGEPAKETV